MNKITLSCSVTDHKLGLDRRALEMQLKALEDGHYTLTIEPLTDNISHRQRKYFFGVVIKELIVGFADKGITVTSNEVRTLLEDLFIYREEYNPILDTTLKARISFSASKKGITREEFNKVKESIQRHAATEWGIIIPDPSEKIFND